MRTYSMRNLDEVLAAINTEREIERQSPDDYDSPFQHAMTSLPTFGSREIDDTTNIWSWDDTHMIIQNDAGFVIVPRTDLDRRPHLMCNVVYERQ